MVWRRVVRFVLTFYWAKRGSSFLHLCLTNGHKSAPNLTIKSFNGHKRWLTQEVRYSQRAMIALKQQRDEQLTRSTRQGPLVTVHQVGWMRGKSRVRANKSYFKLKSESMYFDGIWGRLTVILAFIAPHACRVTSAPQNAQRMRLYEFESYRLCNLSVGMRDS